MANIEIEKPLKHGKHQNRKPLKHGKYQNRQATKTRQISK